MGGRRCRSVSLTTLWCTSTDRPTRPSGTPRCGSPSDASALFLDLGLDVGVPGDVEQGCMVTARGYKRLVPRGQGDSRSCRPRALSSVAARLPWSSSRYSIVSRRHTCLDLLALPPGASCITRLVFHDGVGPSSPENRRSADQLLQLGRRQPSPRACGSGSGVMKTSPMISADLRHASSIGFASNFCSSLVMTVRDLSSRLKL